MPDDTPMEASAPRPPLEDEITAFLTRPASYPARVGDVAVIETHGARVFLAGDKAYKVKKPVRLPYLDFSTLDLRHAALAREIELNRPHAPEIYLRLVPITRGSDGGLTMGGDSVPVEWALEMRRFAQECLLSEIAGRGPLDTTTCKRLAAMTADYHRHAPQVQSADGRAIVENTYRPLLSQLEKASEVGGIAELAAMIRNHAQDALARDAGLLQQRARDGAVRRCHGDLHLGNIVMIDGVPIPFDALEFDEAMATTDVLYDLAFLLMDLDARGDRAAANVVLNAYVGAEPIGGEIEGLACLPLFLAMRALVRSVVALARARQRRHAEGMQSRTRGTALAEVRKLASLAAGYLDPPPPLLVAVGGLSGTGKSTLAAALAPLVGAAPGALHLRSDVERKRYFQVPETQRLDASHYSQEAADTIYGRLYDKASRALAARHSAVVDAVYLKPEERKRIEATAEQAGAAFLGLWLEAPAQTMIARVEARHGDASDADANVVRTQLEREIGEMTWTRIDAGADRSATLAAAAALLPRHLRTPL
jgi:aminoglycoside phosphotransferase family enzyme/predicted kinase